MNPTRLHSAHLLLWALSLVLLSVAIYFSLLSLVALETSETFPSLAYKLLLKVKNGALRLLLRFGSASKPSMPKETFAESRMKGWEGISAKLGSAWRMIAGEPGKRSREKMETIEQRRAREIVEGLKRHIPPKGRAHYGPIWFCLAFGVLLAFAIGREPKYPIETHHNVYVWSQVKGVPDTWWISSDEPEPNKLPLMRWNCCQDFPCSTVMDIGIIASTLKYEERGSCKSIRASGLGWTWEKEIPYVTTSR